MKGKRGQAILSSLIYMIVELVIVAMFITAVVVKVNNAADDQTYQKRFYARDLALLTDAMMAAEGDLQVEHELVTPRPLTIDIYLKHGSVAITDHVENEEEIPSEVSFLYGTSPIVQVKPSVSKSSNSTLTVLKDEKYERSVILKKAQGSITITDPDKSLRVADVNLPSETR